MFGLDILWDYANGGFGIAAWEMIFYVAVMALYALTGRARSCLINSFAFTFYWGFKYLLPVAFSANGLSQTAFLTYVLCGLAIYGLATVSFLMHRLKKEKIKCALNGGGFL